MDPVSEQRLAQVCPELAERVRRAHDQFAARTGSFFRVVEGLRTYDRQDELFAQGRTKPGPKVTNALGGYSNHNFGMAVDCVPDIDGSATFAPDWNTAHPHWHVLVDCLKAQGLAWGGDWRGSINADVDHFQLPGPATPTDHDRASFNSGGLEAVWKSYGFPSTVMLAASAYVDARFKADVVASVLEDIREDGLIPTALEGWQA